MILGLSVGFIFVVLVGMYIDEELIDFLEEEILLDVIEKEVSIFKNIVEKRSVLSIKDLEVSVNNIILNLIF